MAQSFNNSRWRKVGKCTLVPHTDDQVDKMLRDTWMAGIKMLHRSADFCDQRQLRAGSDSDHEGRKVCIRCSRKAGLGQLR